MNKLIDIGRTISSLAALLLFLWAVVAVVTLPIWLPLWLWK